MKRAALGALRSAGIFSVIADSARRRNSLAILCYHGISIRDEHNWEGLLYITPDLFRRRMEALKTFGANVLPLSDAIERLRNGSLPPRSVAITFDDGFYDFLRYAVPILSEFEYPCTLYWTTHYAAYALPIFDLIVPYLLWKSGRSTVDLQPFGLSCELPVTTYDERRHACSLLRVQAEQRRLDTVGKNDCARQLANFLGVDFDEVLRARMFQILNRREASEVHRAGIDIQLHGHRHRTPRERTAFLRELDENAAIIADVTGRMPSHFCYPSGDSAPEFLPWLREAGVKSAVTCALALARPSFEPLLLPRLLDHSSISDSEFESWLCGLRA